MKHIYLFSTDNQAGDYGIGTYLRELEACLSSELEIALTVVELQSTEKEFSVVEIAEVRHIKVPSTIARPYWQFQAKKMESYNLSVCSLLKKCVTAEEDNVFHLNYLQHDSLVQYLCKIDPSCNIVFTIHYLNWYSKDEGGSNYSGYLLYFITTKKCKSLDMLIAKYIQQVNENFNKNGWYTPFYLKDANPTMVVNMGTPHGITGILLLLLIVLESGYQVVTPAIVETCDFLLENRFAKKGTSFSPSVIKHDGKKIDSGMAWCYGDLMDSYAILKAGILLKQSYYKEIGYKMLLQQNKRTDYLKNDLCLCHGHSSLLLIYKSIYKLTCDKLFWQRHLFWYKKTSVLLEKKLTEYKQEINSDLFFGNLSLFAGFPGSFLSLLAPDMENDEWSKILLL